MLSDAPRLKMMADKLHLEIYHGRIDNEFVVNFIESVRDKLIRRESLTDKQVAKLEELFERY